jgi:hypothetical protein
LGALALSTGMLPALAKAKERAQRTHCVNSMKQVCLAARVYANNHDGKFPPDLLTLSNDLATPKFLHCKADTKRTRSEDWASVSSANVSYEFLLPGVAANAPQVVLLRCPIHNNAGMTDGSVQMLSRSRRERD